jgi:hypothetical protein
MGPFWVYSGGASCTIITCEPLTGACCDDNTSTCTIENIADCQSPWQRFAPGLTTCDDLVPPCGVTELGACCFADQSCLDLTPTDCVHAGTEGGIWTAGECASYQCPPVNDGCDNATYVEDGLHTFNTLGAGTDGPLVTGCSMPENDIWFRYQPKCTGTVIVSLCLSTDFDTVLAIYDTNTCVCPPATSDQIACDDDGCGFANGPSEIILDNVSVTDCYLIRIGGASGETGDGSLYLSCIPAASGACCHYDGTCEELLETECTLPGDAYHDAVPCSIVDCPEPPIECCVGDARTDGELDGLDIEAFIALLLDPPEIGTVEFCHADADENLVIDLDDVPPFVQKLLSAEDCPILCCQGDTNEDGLLNGLDTQGMIDAVIDPPTAGTAEFCPANVNKDAVIDLLDVEAFIQLLLDGATCTQVPPIECCHGDTNGDGEIDEFDEPLLINAILNPPAEDSLAFCRADVDQNGSLNLDDRDAFDLLLLNGISCPPENDDCDDAMLITDNLTAFDTLDATTDGVAHPGSGCESGGDGGQLDGDIWYLYTASCTGTLRVEICDDAGATPGNADFDTRIAVYDTCDCLLADDLTLLGCNDNGGTCAGGTSDLDGVPVQQDQCYLIRIGGAGGLTGTGTISITCTP